MPLRFVTVACLLLLYLASAYGQTPQVVRLPDDGIQPRAVVDESGVLHVVYYQGPDTAGDLFYIRSTDAARSFSSPIRVNSQPGSSIAAGAIRGSQIALGKNGSLHVAWNGSSTAQPKGPPNPEAPSDSPHSGLPLLYTHLNPTGDAFEPQRNLMQHTFALDGGGTVAADSQGGVYVAWHGKAPGAPEGEEGRRVYLARSLDGGATFDAEAAVSTEGTGTCACCGMKLFAARSGVIYGLYRTATNLVHRDMALLVSSDRGRTFQTRRLHQWEIAACPMSSMSFAESEAGVVAAWETEGQVYWARLSADPDASLEPVAATGDGARRKYPEVAVDPAGNVLLSWAETPGWKKPGTLHWQIFDAAGSAKPPETQDPALPVWSFPAAFHLGSRGFGIIR